MAGNCIVDDAVCREASRKEILRDVYKRQALYCVALAVGSVLGAVILSLLKKNRTDAE